MRWQDIRMRWDELDEYTRARLVTKVKERLNLTDDGVEISIETWAGAVAIDVELEELEGDLELEPIDEAARHPGPNDVHEQREDDQEAEGVLHWPPHIVRLVGVRGVTRH
jgi:hypothetical protein